MATTKVPFNLYDDDAKLFAKLKVKIERRIGLSQPNVNVIRLALSALAEKEGVK